MSSRLTRNPIDIDIAVKSCKVFENKIIVTFFFRL